MDDSEDHRQGTDLGIQNEPKGVDKWAKRPHAMIYRGRRDNDRFSPLCLYLDEV